MVLSSSDRSLPLELHVIAASPLVLLEVVGSTKKKKYKKWPIDYGY